jgi:hypothetical protein
MVPTWVARPESSKGVSSATHALRRLRACHPETGFLEPCLESREGGVSACGSVGGAEGGLEPPEGSSVDCIRRPNRKRGSPGMPETQSQGRESQRWQKSKVAGTDWPIGSCHLFVSFRQIRQAQEFLVLLTPASVNRPWILLETGAACGCDPPPRIIAVRYYVETDNIPSLIKGKKGFHLNELDAYLDEVARRVEGRHETIRRADA